MVLSLGLQEPATSPALGATVLASIPYPGTWEMCRLQTEAEWMEEGGVGGEAVRPGKEGEGKPTTRNYANGFNLSLMDLAGQSWSEVWTLATEQGPRLDL